MSTRLTCKHCGFIDWDYAPRLLQIKQLLERRGPMTSPEVAEAVGISIANAVNLLMRLIGLGLACRDGGSPNPNGGVTRTYRTVAALIPPHQRFVADDALDGLADAARCEGEFADATGEAPE